MSQPTMAQLYRSYAAQEQKYAAEALLPNVRQIHEQSATKWLQLATQAERPSALSR